MVFRFVIRQVCWKPSGKKTGHYEIFGAFYLKLFCRSLSGLSSWRSTSLLHPTPFQPETGLEAGKEERQMLRSFNRYEDLNICFWSVSVLTVVDAAVFMLMMAKWDCFSTSTSWSETEMTILVVFLGFMNTILLRWDLSTLERFHSF